MPDDKLIEAIALGIRAWPTGRYDEMLPLRSSDLARARATLAAIEQAGYVLLPAKLPPEAIEAGNYAIDEHIDSWNYDSGSGYCVGATACVACIEAVRAATKENNDG